MTHSKSKGKKGELEFCELLRSHGFDARRSQQYCGSEHSADVLSDLPYHFEVKRSETLSVYKALEQAKTDANGKAVPVVAHRRNRHSWIIIMDADDFLKLQKKGVFNGLDIQEKRIHE